MCDEKPDCENEADEGMNCTLSCSDVHCLENQFCQKLPDGNGICLCENGYKMQNGSCVDIDECEILPPYCSQVIRIKFFDRFSRFVAPA